MPVMSTVVASTAVAATMAVQTVPVSSVEPIIQNRPVMVQESHCTPVQHSYGGGNGGTILGGIIGGAIGSQIGNSEGTRRVMTGVGAIIGAQHGRQYDSPPQVYYSQHCAPSYVQRAVPTITGYKVSYVVDGVPQTVVMSHNPGAYVTVERNYVIR